MNNLIQFVFNNEWIARGILLHTWDIRAQLKRMCVQHNHNSFSFFVCFPAVQQSGWYCWFFFIFFVYQVQLLQVWRQSSRDLCHSLNGYYYYYYALINSMDVDYSCDCWISACLLAFYVINLPFVFVIMVHQAGLVEF